MTYSGARGRALKDMAKALSFFTVGPSRDRHRVLYTLAGRLASLPGEGALTSFRSGDSLWYQRDFHFAPAYLQLARTDFRARISPVDFCPRCGFEPAPKSIAGSRGRPKGRF